MPNEFEKLADTTSDAASKIKCSAEEYVEGLDVVIQRLQDDQAAAKGE